MLPLTKASNGLEQQTSEDHGNILAKWKKAMEDWGIQDVETVKLFLQKTVVKYVSFCLHHFILIKCLKVYCYSKNV